MVSSKYLLIMCYECEISVSVHNSYHEVEVELESLSFNKETIDEILIGDTYNDWDDHGQVKVQRIELV